VLWLPREIRGLVFTDRWSVFKHVADGGNLEDLYRKADIIGIAGVTTFDEVRWLGQSFYSFDGSGE